ncbi:MAG: hydroxyacylglutathione hydrolase [Alphaproteobacteria bacterium]|nr:hydroxyacylglutathione hydrolase [Alphaproteobacteria bacterium]
MTSDIIVKAVPCLQDNYAWLLHESHSGQTAVIDPGQAEPILAALHSQGWTLSHIINTHHHGDHVGGNLALLAATNAQLYASAYDLQHQRIPGSDSGRAHPLHDGQPLLLGTQPLTTIAVPGHTLGHIALYHAPQDTEPGLLFSGDTLFSLGCGRLFEGTAPQLWQSLKRLRALPANTLMYAGHEYTLKNSSFVRYLGLNSPELEEYLTKCQQKRSKNHPTLPNLMAIEQNLNPFLRADCPKVAAAVMNHRDVEPGLANQALSPQEIFGYLRRLRDNF